MASASGELGKILSESGDNLQNLNKQIWIV
jgi:hypothetical protein